MIRYARTADQPAIAKVVETAFGRADEARIVERLRADGDAMFELVAEAGGAVVGHVMFSRLWADRSELYTALGPMAVRPDVQRSGIGSGLVRAGLESAPEFGAVGVLVLGHTDYYPKFGFTAAAAAQVASPFRGLPAFMALGLAEGAFAAPMTVAYPDAFGS